MGAATINRTTASPVFPNGTANFVSKLNGLKLSMGEGKPVSAADMNALNALIGEWDRHTHTVSDLNGSDTYGNISSYGAGTLVTKTSTAVNGATPPSISVKIGDPILATSQNALRSAIEYFRASHTHSIEDATS